MTEQQKEIQVNNVLLAVFMGLTLQECGGYLCSDSQEVIEVENLTYNEDWQMLMQVVDKIEGLESNNITFTIDISKGITIVNCYGVTLINSVHFDANTVLLIIENECKLKATYLACIDFVKWYNENKGTCSKQ